MTDNKKLFTLTGPSCSGKTTLIRKLIDTGHFCEVVSFTSRQPRGGEEHGKDYYFLDAKLCEQLVANGETAEAIKFKDNWYGITKSEIDLSFLSGKTPIVIVEPKGLRQLRSTYDCFSVYVDCDLETLYTRFLSRFKQTENPNIPYEAKRVGSIYLEQKEWPGKVRETGEIDFFTTFYEGKEQEVVDTVVNASKHYNKTK
jgi:guanylate kinase